MKERFRIIALLVLLSLCLQSKAAIYFVTDTNDTTQITSLRGAIIAANRIGGKNTIILGDSPGFQKNGRQRVYQLTILGPDEDAAFTGDLNITRGEMTVVGMSPGVTIDATGLYDRVFKVSSGASLTLENLTITGGMAAGMNYWTSNDGESGGAIYNDGTLVLEHCLLIANSSGNANYVFPPAGNGGNGGAIYNDGELMMKRCIVAENICGTGSNNQGTGAGGAGGNGGGIFNAGQMTLETCIISNNFSGPGQEGSTEQGIVTVFAPGGSGGDGGVGGGICNAGTANVSFCTIDNNGSGRGGDGINGGTGGNGGDGGFGGGIFNQGSLNLNTCTISENFCGAGGAGGPCFSAGSSSYGGNGGNGGGVYNAGLLSSTSCTIAFNLAGSGGNGSEDTTGGEGGSGGGIFDDASGTNTIVRNTLIALNAANPGGVGGTNGAGFDVAGDFASQGFNLIGTGDGGVGFINGTNDDKVGSNEAPIDPLLGPLQMNGGFTPTHALLWGSPAIDQGQCFGVHRDQRGRYRPYIYHSIPKPPGGDGNDIGAFELDFR